MSIFKKITCLILLQFFLTAALALPESHAAALKINSRGQAVAELQKKLSSLNYPIAACDGIFGPETKRAVLLFQRDNRLKPTGVVDSKTRRALKKAKPAKKTAPKAAKPIKAEETQPFVQKKHVPAIMKTARQYIGAPYRFGGATPKGFDCSGYVQYVFGKYNYMLPRSADIQYNIGQKISAAAMREGDLVFFSADKKEISHCGIYTGGGKFIHASTSKGVRIDELKDPYWKPLYAGAKRITK